MNAPAPVLDLPPAWDALFGAGRAAVEAALPGFLAPRRWFAAKARRLRSARIADAVPWPLEPAGGAAGGELEARIALVDVAFADGGAETYVLPLALASGGEAARLRAAPGAAVAALRGGALLADATAMPRFSLSLLAAICDGRSARGDGVEIVCAPGRALGDLLAGGAALAPAPMGVEQSNTSIVFGRRLALKVFRRLEAGANPDLEAARFFAERTSFRQIAPFAGAIEWRRGAEGGALALLQGYVENRGDAWAWALEEAGGFLARSIADGRAAPAPPAACAFEAAAAPLPAGAGEAVGAPLDAARLLGRRTAEMHLALASDARDPAFAPEAFSAADLAALAASMEALVRRNLADLRRLAPGFPPEERAAAERALGLEGGIVAALRALGAGPTSALRTRVHGDLHQGQVLVADGDFVFIDFEGEPARTIEERRAKRSPLVDVAGMLRSFHYAASAVLAGQGPGGVAPARRAAAAPWARLWHRSLAAEFLRAYLAAADGAAFLPRDRAETGRLLSAFLIEKAVYELGYEMNNRPGWVGIPLEGIAGLVAGG